MVTASNPRTGASPGQLEPASELMRQPVLDGPSRTADIAGICPFLLSADLAWRAASPSREHRCTAVLPAISLRPEVQRELCLVAAHAQCERFLAATGSARLGGASSRSSLPRSHRPLARMTPVVLERGRPIGPIADVRLGGRLAQAGMVGLLALALGAIVVARTLPPVQPAGPAASPSAVLAGAPTATPFEPSPSPEASASPEPTPTTTPPATPAFRLYRVRSGDTLLAIAHRYGTTVRAIARANGITQPDRLKIGQVLRIP